VATAGHYCRVGGDGRSYTVVSAVFRFELNYILCGVGCTHTRRSKRKMEIESQIENRSMFKLYFLLIGVGCARMVTVVK